jgi:hypothetical protein
VHKAFRDDICLVAAVVALARRTVHKRVVGADERAAGTPLRGIFWDLA